MTIGERGEPIDVSAAFKELKTYEELIPGYVEPVEAFGLFALAIEAKGSIALRYFMDGSSVTEGGIEPLISYFIKSGRRVAVAHSLTDYVRTDDVKVIVVAFGSYPGGVKDMVKGVVDSLPENGIAVFKGLKSQRLRDEVAVYVEAGALVLYKQYTVDMCAFVKVPGSGVITLLSGNEIPAGAGRNE